MMITEEMIAEDEKRWNDRNIVAELGYCGKNVCHRKNITNDDIRFYAYIMRQAHAMLKEQGHMTPEEFKDGLLKMFSSIWECEIDHPMFQDTIGELMDGVMQLNKKAVKWDG